MIENVAVQAIRSEQDEHWWDGAIAGYDEVNQPLPAWYRTKPPILWTPYERGYWFAREYHAREQKGLI